MKKIRMLRHVNGTVNGVRMGPYFLGHEYIVPEVRAALFLGSAMAEEVVAPPVETAAPEVPTLTPAGLAALDDRNKPDAAPAEPGMTPTQLAESEDQAQAAAAADAPPATIKKSKRRK